MIQVSDVTMSENERKYVLDVLERRELSHLGPYVTKFESQLKTVLELPRERECLATCNGTAALHLALLAAGVQPGDEVIVPVLTYVATANAVRYCGATPVFVDVDPKTWCLDLEAVRKKITEKTKAVVVVQLFGHWPHMTKLRALTNACGVTLVEDAAQGLGGRFDATPAGAWGATASFSFYANKAVTTGEGGAVIVGSSKLSHLVARLRSHGASTSLPRYYHDVLGYNYRMTNLQAAIGCAQMDRFKARQDARTRVVELYRSSSTVRKLDTQKSEEGGVPSNWMFAVRLPTGLTPKLAERRMRQDGVETRPMFYPMHLLPMYQEPVGTYPVAEDLQARVLCLPTHANLTVSDIETVCRSLGQALELAS